MTASHEKPDAASPSVVDLDERKERILHTRVPDSLDRHIKRRARSLGMSVSTVVRNVLLTTFGLVEDIVSDSTDIALAVTGHEGVRSRDRARRLATSAPPEPIAWQEAVLNVNAVCGECNAMLPKGTRAAVGVREQPAPRAVLCRACLAALERRAGSPARGR